jgi:hypothetical protein
LRRSGPHKTGTARGCAFGSQSARPAPAREALKLLDAITGNNDAHGKNYSLLYLPDSPKATVSPAYDLLSTVVYPGLSRKMAMSIGGEYRPDYVQPRHLNQLLERAGLGHAAARRRIRARRRSPAAAYRARAVLAGEAWDAPVLARIVQTIERRASRMLEIAAPAPARVRAGSDGTASCAPASQFAGASDGVGWGTPRPRWQRCAFRR